MKHDVRWSPKRIEEVEPGSFFAFWRDDGIHFGISIAWVWQVHQIVNGVAWFRKLEPSGFTINVTERDALENEAVLLIPSAIMRPLGGVTKVIEGAPTSIDYGPLIVSDDKLFLRGRARAGAGILFDVETGQQSKLDAVKATAHVQTWEVVVPSKDDFEQIFAFEPGKT